MVARNRAVKVSFDLAALQHNFQQVKKHAPGSKIMPVIKANAYGHDILQVADALGEADGFAVAQLPEAFLLRDSGIDKPLSVFQGFASQAELEQCIKYRIRPAISQIWQIDLLESTLVDSSMVMDVWLKINTGMGRLGIQPTEFVSSWQRLENIAAINQSGIMMHFANADDPTHLSNQQQIDCFQALTENINTETSVSNSGAIISQLCKSQDWVRPGIMIYGSSPVLAQSADELSLRAVMSVRAELIAINSLTRGQHVGYGDNWSCPEDMPVGIVNIGYGDGYPRHAPTGTPVAVNGQLTRLIGRVSMDSIAVDLRNINAKCGDSVELWGKQVSVDDVARKAGTISYELLCSAGRC